MLTSGTPSIIIRNILSILVLFIVTKILGKKQLSQLTFFDYIVGIVIGSIAGAFSIEKNINYMDGITAMMTWGLVAYGISYISLKSLRARRFFNSTPTILIKNGIILNENLKKEKINLNELLEELRLKGIFNLSDVESAIVETGGKISFQLKSQKRPLTPSDLNIETGYEGLPTNVIIDGKILSDSLQLVNLDEKWLKEQLQKSNISSEKDVFLAVLDSSGGLYISKKNKIK